jgi:hypothetical protein
MLSGNSWGQWQFVYTAYCDDSGKESDGRWIVIGGYLAHEGYWSAFAPRWAHELRRHDISALHMKDAIQCAGEYKDRGWTVPKRDEVLADFLAIIKTAHLIGFAVGVDAPAWKAHLKSARPNERITAMEFCFIRIMGMVARRMARVEPADRVLLCFDTDREFASARLNRMLELRAKHPDLTKAISSIAFADVKLHYPLQAADVVAWLARKQLMQQTGGFESLPLYRDLQAAFPGHPLEYAGEVWTEENFKRDMPFTGPASDAPSSSGGV